jgi:uncharacterized membrane protein YhaH (DUF805 family)
MKKITSFKTFTSVCLQRKSLRWWSIGQSAIVSIFRYDHHFWRSQWVVVIPCISLYFVWTDLEKNRKTYFHGTVEVYWWDHSSGCGLWMIVGYVISLLLTLFVFYPVLIQMKRWRNCSRTSFHFLIIIPSLHFSRSVRYHPPGYITRLRWMHYQNQQDGGSI